MTHKDRDPDALTAQEDAFLDKLEADIQAGAAKDIDPELVARMKALTAEIEVDLDAPIEGDVAI